MTLQHKESRYHVFTKPCRYCQKELLFDSRIKSSNYLLPLNPDRSIHEKCWENKIKNKIGLGTTPDTPEDRATTTPVEPPTKEVLV